MHIDWWTLLLQAINFLVLLWLLHRLLYRPVLAAIDARQATIKRDREAAAEARRTAEETSAAQRQRLDEIEEARRAILSAAESDATARRDNVLADARREAESLAARTRDQLSSERHDAALALRREACRLATAIAQRLLQQTTKPSAEAFLEILAVEFDSAKTAGPPAASEALAEVACMPALDPAAEARWRQTICQRLGARSVRFSADPDLLAGARITIAGLQLEASWRDALARAEMELIEDAQTE